MGRLVDQKEGGKALMRGMYEGSLTQELREERVRYGKKGKGQSQTTAEGRKKVYADQRCLVGLGISQSFGEKSGELEGGT